MALQQRYAIESFVAFVADTRFWFRFVSLLRRAVFLSRAAIFRLGQMPFFVQSQMYIRFECIVANITGK